jgi:hypothetical protein
MPSDRVLRVITLRDAANAGDLNAEIALADGRETLTEAEYAEYRAIIVTRFKAIYGPFNHGEIATRLRYLGTK